MQRLLLAGILAGITLTGSPATSEMVSSPSSVSTPVTRRYEVYFAYAAGLRFVYPEGYRVDSATAYQPPDPDAPLRQSWEIWKAEDYQPFGLMYQSEPDGSESPPHISIEVFANPENKPLEDWMELATSPARVRTVAGQGAIAYTATGLYEADVVLLHNPAGDVVRLRVGYLDAADPMRQVFQTVVDSLVFDQIAANGTLIEVDYRRLQALLMAQDWQAANLETTAIVRRLMDAGYFYPHLEGENIADLPCDDLRRIDALWSRYSEGRYGFAAQQAIWRSLADLPAEQRAEQLGQQVGWRRSAPTDTLFGDSLWRPDTELTYAATAPVGQFPWLGVSSLILERMIQDSGAACGSCTVDAMYISRDRMPDLLEILMPRLDECLCSAGN